MTLSPPANVHFMANTSNQDNNTPPYANPTLQVGQNVNSIDSEGIRLLVVINKVTFDTFYGIYETLYPIEGKNIQYHPLEVGYLCVLIELKIFTINNIICLLHANMAPKTSAKTMVLVLTDIPQLLLLYTLPTQYDNDSSASFILLSIVVNSCRTTILLTHTS